MEFKRRISADVDPEVPHLPDIYGFEGLPTFPPEIATFRNATLMIFPNYARKSRSMMSRIV